MIKEGINFEGIKKALQIKLDRVKPCYDVELAREKEIKPASVSADCPEEFKALAERLVAIQNEKGEIKREYIEYSDYKKLENIIRKPKYKMGIKELVNFMVDGAYYVSRDVLYTRNIVRLVKEIEEIYNKYHEQYDAIPLNELSYETGTFININKKGLSKEEFVGMILENFKSEYANVKMVEEIARATVDESDKDKFMEELKRLEPYYEIELAREKKIKPASVSADCPEELKALAERLVAIQNEKGEIKREYIEYSDYNKLNHLGQLKYNIRVIEVVSFMVDNAYYVDNDVLNARNIVRLVKEFEELYNKYYEQYKVIPLNEFSSITSNFISHHKKGLSKEEFVRISLGKFKSEYANVKMVERFSRAMFAGDSKDNFISYLENIKPLVERERQLALGEKFGKVSVSADCPEEFKTLAENLVAIQNKYGEIKKEYIEKDDINKLRRLGRLKHGSLKETIYFIVDNAYYIDDDVKNARHILRCLIEFGELYNTYYERYKCIPLNEISDEVDICISSLRNSWYLSFSKEEMFRTILGVYYKEFANIEMLEEKNKQLLTEEEISKIISQLNSIKDENGSLDAIFAPEYESYFKTLCERLKYSGYNFNDFIAKNTNLNYTMCFKCNDTEKAVKKMCEFYKENYGTTVGISVNDRYLENKIKTAKSGIGDYTIKGVLEKMGVSADNDDTYNMVLSKEELEIRELVLLKKLEKLFPDKHISLNSITNDEKLYKELILIAERMGFGDVNAYLISKEYSRDLRTIVGEKGIFLSERDLKYYGFLDGCETAEDVEKILASYNIELADPYECIRTYRRLAYEKKDTLGNINVPDEEYNSLFSKE